MWKPSSGVLSLCHRLSRPRSRFLASSPSPSSSPLPSSSSSSASSPSSATEFDSFSSLTEGAAPLRSQAWAERSRADSIIFSGIQPTGIPHLGNYLGAISQWVALQDTPQNTFFTVVDLHAITLPQDPATLRASTLQLAASLIACGIDENKSSLFIQSRVHQHSELCWLLACATPHHQLTTMTQYKDKKSEKPHLGLFAYPVLMAADMLLYKATHVPVGEDQIQHLQLAAKIAKSFNVRYQTDFFPLPQGISQREAVGRVMSLRDGTKKMSKSDKSDMTRINLTDSADDIADKITKAKTDSIQGVTYDMEVRPDLGNLLNIYGAITGRSPRSVALEHKHSDKQQFKTALTEALVARVCPVGNEIVRLLKDPSHITRTLKKGEEAAKELASKNLASVKEIIGLLAFSQ